MAADVRAGITHTDIVHTNNCSQTEVVVVKHIVVIRTAVVHATCVHNELIISQVVSFSKGCDKIGDRVSSNHESCHIFIYDLKVVLMSFEKYRTLYRW